MFFSTKMEFWKINLKFLHYLYTYDALYPFKQILTNVLTEIITAATCVQTSRGPSRAAVAQDIDYLTAKTVSVIELYTRGYLHLSFIIGQSC